MIEELNRFPLLRRGGAYSVCKKSPQSAMKSLKYSVDVMGDMRNLLCIFPQGIIRPPHFRPIEFQTGLAYIAQKAVKKYGKINLVPISIDYCFFRDNRPEVVVTFGDKMTLDKNSNMDRKILTHSLEHAMLKVCDEQFEDISHGHIEDYDILFKQHLKWYRRIEQRLKRIDVPPSEAVCFSFISSPPFKRKSLTVLHRYYKTKTALQKFICNKMQKICTQMHKLDKDDNLIYNYSLKWGNACELPDMRR